MLRLGPYAKKCCPLELLLEFGRLCGKQRISTKAHLKTTITRVVWQLHCDPPALGVEEAGGATSYKLADRSLAVDASTESRDKKRINVLWVINFSKVTSVV